MILTEKRYRKERGETSETYQAFYLTEEIEGDRKYCKIEIDYIQRWRSRSELADYLRWIADSVMED